MFTKRRKIDGPKPEAAAPEADPAPVAAGADAGTAGKPRPPTLPEPRPDTGLGVPPYRPAPPKEAPAMSMGRAPFPTSNPGPNPGTSTPPAVPARAPRPGARDPGERRTLVVGRGISVQGTVQNAERLVVEGTVEATMIHATELSIALGGVFKGEVEVEEAEIAGVIDGTLTVRSSLVVRTSGEVLGTARCRRLQVEDGGKITGRIEMLTDNASRTDAPRTEAPASDTPI